MVDEVEKRCADMVTVEILGQQADEKIPETFIHAGDMRRHNEIWGGEELMRTVERFAHETVNRRSRQQAGAKGLSEHRLRDDAAP